MPAALAPNPIYGSIEGVIEMIKTHYPEAKQATLARKHFFLKDDIDRVSTNYPDDLPIITKFRVKGVDEDDLMTNEPTV